MANRVFIAASVDGFIARRDDSLDWLTGVEPPADGGDYGYSDFIKNIDALVMGRRTFEWVKALDEWPYTKPVFVLSRTLPAAPSDKYEIITGEPVEITARLNGRGYGELYIDGGLTIQTFLRAGLIDELTITRVPVLLGAGLPLFGELFRDVRLRHLETRAFGNGLVQTRYAVIK